MTDYPFTRRGVGRRSDLPEPGTGSFAMALVVLLPLVATAVSGCAMRSPEAGASGDDKALSQVEESVEPSAKLLASAHAQFGSDAAGADGSVWGSYLAGRFASRKRDLSSAADFMLHALAGDPENPELLGRAFMLAASEGRHAESLRLANILAAQDDTHGLARIVLAIDAAYRDSWDEADGLLTEMPERGITAVVGPLLGAWVRVAQGRMDEAERFAAPLGERRGFEVLYGLHAGLMNEVGGRDEAAAAHYRKAVSGGQEPTLRLAWIIGNFFERSGHGEEARAIYQSFLDRGQDSLVIRRGLERIDRGELPAPLVADGRQGVAELLFNLASMLSQERAEEAALIQVHLALRLKPDFDVAQILLGEILQSQNRGAEAIEVYRRIPPESDVSWIVRLRVAQELERLGRIDDAVAELKDLAALRPDHLEPLLRLGNMYRGLERFGEAAEAYDLAIARLKQPEARHWMLYYFRGIALERTKQWDRAEKDLLQALELQPEQPFVMNYLAYSWVEQKQNLDRAKGMLARAVELRPEDGYIVDSLGWVYYRLGEYDNGVRYLERAVELRPQDPTINDHLGDVYWRVGRFQEARFQWRRALSLDPEPGEAPKIETKLEHGLLAKDDDKNGI